MRTIAAVGCAVGFATGVRGQTFEDLSTFRNLVLPYTELFQIEGGVLGALATDEDPAAGLADEIAWDARLLYHNESFGSEASTLDAYAGRDGLLASIRDGRIVGETSTRLQLSARLWQFWREGFYRGDNFVPVGRYEGRDYEAYLGFGREATQGLFVEFGPYYRKNEFERNETTAANYVIPDDYDAYGARIHLEQNTVQHDRRSGQPRAGYIFTVVGEREWNDSDRAIGVSSGFLTELPSAVWRARARVEWYIPQGAASAWEIFASGALTDEKDRVVNYEAQHPPGNLWVDAQLRLRLPLGDSFVVTPFAHGQFTRILQEDGTSSDKEFFFGGGLETWVHMSEAVSLRAWYSFLDNESRPSVSITEDVHGQHMFFAGVVLRFGGARR